MSQNPADAEVQTQFRFLGNNLFRYDNLIIFSGKLLLYFQKSGHRSRQRNYAAIAIVSGGEVVP